jgi:hypothetical protein
MIRKKTCISQEELSRGMKLQGDIFYPKNESQDFFLKN